VDFRKVVDFHRSHGKLATVTAVHPPGRFGELMLDDRRAQEFNEKPQVSAGWISGGFFLFARGGLGRLSESGHPMLESQALQVRARDGQLMAYCHEDFWFCIDTPRDYMQLSEMWASGRAPWAVWQANGKR